MDYEFKIGDKVKRIGSFENFDCSSSGIYTVSRVDEDDGFIDLEEVEDLDYIGRFAPEFFELERILDNPLNRKLYPNRVPKDGLLFPKDSVIEPAEKPDKEKAYLKAGDKVDINVGYFTADKTGWHSFGKTIEYLGEKDG